MTDKEIVLTALRSHGASVAMRTQENAPYMTNDNLNYNSDFIPSFSSSVELRNMIDRPSGFVCISPEGRVVRLLQPYDSTIYPQPPEELPAQWGFAWSKDPIYAKPFISISTSPYNTDEVCVGEDGSIYKSLIDNNVWEPTSYPAGWEIVE